MRLTPDDAAFAHASNPRLTADPTKEVTKENRAFSTGR